MSNVLRSTPGAPGSNRVAKTPSKNSQGSQGSQGVSSRSPHPDRYVFSFLVLFFFSCEGFSFFASKKKKCWLLQNRYNEYLWIVIRIIMIFIVLFLSLSCVCVLCLYVYEFSSYLPFVSIFCVVQLEIEYLKSHKKKKWPLQNYRFFFQLPAGAKKKRGKKKNLQILLHTNFLASFALFLFFSLRKHWSEL